MERVIAEHLHEFNETFSLLIDIPIFKFKLDQTDIITYHNLNGRNINYFSESVYNISFKEVLTIHDISIEIKYTFYLDQLNIELINERYHDRNIKIISNYERLIFNLHNKLKVYYNSSRELECIIATIDDTKLIFLFNIERIGKIRYYEEEASIFLELEILGRKPYINYNDYLLYQDAEGRYNYFTMNNNYTLSMVNKDLIEKIRKDPFNYSLYQEFINK